MTAELINDVLWRRMDEVSLEHCRLLRRADAHVLDGRVLTIADAQLLEVHYTIDCALDWTTRTVVIETLHGLARQTLHLRRDASGAWWRDGTRLPEFDGFTDVDLSITPSTNTLPIRRLGLQTGEAAVTDAVWVR
ncbi:MAG: putative glycolipid-binding domain-containing protein, partial [Longimicrobiales bacterium]